MGRRSQPFRSWNTWRRLSRAIFFLLFVILIFSLPPLSPGVSEAKVLIAFDPLTSITSALAHRALPPLWIWALIFLVLTLLLGRIWCGWLCPLGTLLDIFPLQRWRVGTHRWREQFRLLKFGLVFVILGAALAGNLTLLALDPNTLIARAMTGAIWPWLEQVLGFLEESLYPIEGMSEWIVFLDTLLRPRIFPSLSVPHLHRFWMVLPVVAVVALNLIAERGWCRSICPLGGFMALISRYSWLRRIVNPGCIECGVCAGVCPTGTIDPTGFQSDAGECTLCMLCVDHCELAENSIRFAQPRATQKPYDLTRRQAISTMGIAFAGSIGLWLEQVYADPLDRTLHPPGSSASSIRSSCVRCGLCLEACPTGALQPAMLEGGISGFWTPKFSPRQGYCDYGCNTCGQVCPVSAIPDQPLETKRQYVIGLAVLDIERCLAWAEDTPCIVCEEMCPLPEKAIVFENPDDEGVLKPIVVEDSCIGCGICEFKCPVEGEAAVRVFAVDAIVSPTLHSKMEGRVGTMF